MCLTEYIKKRIKSKSPIFLLALATQKHIIYNNKMNVGLYGLGRFGYFWGSALAKQFELCVYSRNKEREIPLNTVRVGEKELAQSDVIILCCSISSIPEVAKRIAPYLKRGSLVMDTCSVKRFPVDCLIEFLPDYVEVLGTHPMFGPDSARQKINGLPIVISRGRVSEDSFSQWRTVFTQMGLQVVEMTTDEHDREAAYTQGVTHLLGRILKEMDLQKSPIGTVGYEALLEIMEQTCRDPWTLFLDLQRYNPYTVPMKSLMAEKMEVVIDAIQNEKEKP